MPAPSAGINLLPKTEFETTFWGRFIKWAITTGRYMLILVELVVIIAFLSRFKLDKDLANLSDSINGKKSVLEAASASEQKFRVVQARLNAAGSMLDAQLEARRTMNTITGYTPPEVNLTQIIIQPRQVTISAKTGVQTGLAIFLSRLTADPVWKSVDLTDVLATPTQGIQFTVIAKR
ncbi:MAG: PilN domain-containing protein [bacterium]|nr:PilN domain-containing protein [bacterium]